MELMEPISSPSSKAFEVPTTWLAPPIATPDAILLLTQNSLIMNGARTLPRMPVIRRLVTVRLSIPPSWLLIAIAIGVVTLLGMREYFTWAGTPKRFERMIMVRMLTMLEINVPETIAARCLLIFSLCLYIETAKSAVIGERNIFISMPPLL